MEEVWKPWPINNNYKISSNGQIKNQCGRILKQRLHNGYFEIKLRVDINTPKHFLVHRLVAQTFLPNWVDGCIVDHINGVREDNRVANLRITNSIGNIVYKNDNNFSIYKKVNELIQKIGYKNVEQFLSNKLEELDI